MKTKLICKPILLLALLAGIPHLHGEAPAGGDPYTKGSATAQNAEEAYVPDDTAVLSVSYEVFSLPLGMAAAYQREQISDGELYKRLVTGLEPKTVKQDMFINLRVQSGNQASNEAIQEHMYPCDYEAPELPQSVGLGVAAVPAPSEDAEKKQPTAAHPAVLKASAAPASIDGLIAPISPTMFETRNTCETLEIEPNLLEDRKWVYLRLAPEQVLLVGESKYGQGLSETTMPVFETRRSKTAVKVGVGKPYLLGTFSRPSTSRVDPDSPDLVSFAFVTVTIVSP